MPKEYHGDLTAAGLRFALIVSRFNDFITGRLLEGATDMLVRHGCSADDLAVVRVPGAFEIPVVARRLAGCGEYDAVICLGCIIRGQTPHFDYVAGQAARGVTQAMMESGVPISFGIITADTIEQAVERAGTKAGNKGADAAAGAIEMANLMKKLPGGKA